MPLVLPVNLVCNVSEDIVDENVRVNSRRGNAWFYGSNFEERAKGRAAIICGSGPSLGGSLAEIRERVGDVFALNGAARFLWAGGRVADFQVIVDARSRTAELVGPARKHLFASQVHDDCLKAAPGAILFHHALEHIDDLLPDNWRERDHTLVGGGVSVGIIALILAHAMGYREFHVYGFDSSSREDGESHAFDQPINYGEPMCAITFAGREYRASLTMKRQAEEFLTVARLLEAEGVTIHVHGSGLLPDMWRTPPEQLSEREKYERMWSFPAYRNDAPGEGCADLFLSIAKPGKGATVIDFGCGTGRGAVRLEEAGLQPYLVDFAGNCRDAEAMHLPFYRLDLCEPVPLRAAYGYCTDVLEHIPPGDVDKVLGNLFTSVRRAFLQISTVEDNFGLVINQPLHLTVQPHEWWRERLAAFGDIVHEQDRGSASTFYVERRF